MRSRPFTASKCRRPNSNLRRAPRTRRRARGSISAPLVRPRGENRVSAARGTGCRPRGSFASRAPVAARSSVRRRGRRARAPDHLLPDRLAEALTVIYLIFNEGYSATAGDLTRPDLMAEAIRLGGILAVL